MRILLAASSEEFDATASGFIEQRVAVNPRLSLTLPTGSTPSGMYRHLVHDHARGRFDLSRATVFMLDEYLDLPSYPVGSFAAYLEDHLGEVVFNGVTVVHRLDPSQGPSITADYDRALDAVGGLDLAVIGVGRNGHVGFNEPGAPYDARTRATELAAETLEANFPCVPREQRPTRAVTIGMADLLRARSILMLVAGPHKAKVASLLLDGRFDPLVPATQLLDHRDLTILMDAALCP